MMTGKVGVLDGRSLGILSPVPTPVPLPTVTSHSHPRISWSPREVSGEQG